jgi:hypothetical protein
MKTATASSFRLCFFTGLALELPGPLVWALVSRFGSHQLRGWRYSLADERMLFHWLLPVALALAYVWLTQVRQPAWRWAASGAVLGGLPHLLAAVPRFALLWSLQPVRVRARGLAGLSSLAEPFLRDTARSVLFVALLGGLAALATALAAGARRVATRPHSREWVVRRIEVLAKAHLLLAPLAAACAFMLPWSWGVLAVMGLAAAPELRSFRTLRLLAFTSFALLIGLVGEGIARSRPDQLGALFLVLPRLVLSVLWLIGPVLHVGGLLLGRFFPVLAAGQFLVLVVFTLITGIFCGFACLPALGLARRRPWACATSVGALAGCFMFTVVMALWLAADAPVLTRHPPWQTAVESWLLRAGAYASVPLVALGTMWRFVERDDVRRLCGE